MMKSDHEETSAPKWKRRYTRNNKWAEKKTRKVEEGKEDREERRKDENEGRKGWTDGRKEGRKQRRQAVKWARLDTLAGRFWPMGCMFDIPVLDYQDEVVLDESVTVGELYMVLKMGVLRFYLCTDS